jgi:Tfp pilus assembly protein PilF
LAYYHLNRFEDSLATLQAALRFGASDRTLILLGIAEAFEAMGRTMNAEESYQQAAAAGNLQARIAYGMLLFHQGRAKESVKILKNVELAEPWNTSAVVPVEFDKGLSH